METLDNLIDKKKMYDETNVYLTVKDYDMRCEEIHYCGESELQALTKYKKLEGSKRNILKANVKRQMILGTSFIMSYEVIEVIK
ncbi:hypothetical protein QJR60_17260 (plasmid) [Paraclostridium sordellii]|uniref:hypothetical protein n=1 Tax=Paraclostridium sordellii TaxID=1505 RepID=UPI0030D4A375